jgi:hypothetical protein
MGAPAVCPAPAEAGAARADRAKPAAPQREVAAPPPTQATRAAAPTGQAPPPPQALTHAPPSDAEARRPSRPNKKLLALGALVLAVAVVGVFAYSRLRSAPPTAAAPPTQPPPLTTVEVDDEFLDLEKWTPPPTGWSINPGEGERQLEVSNQTQLGFLTDVAYEDFNGKFTLKLLDDRGAAWALRVAGPDDYYLFYLSGPDGPYPNRFLSYVVRGGQIVPKSERSTNVIAELKAGKFYDVEFRVVGNKITHTLIPAETGEAIRLGDFVDPSNAYPRGGFGFRTYGRERFAVRELWLRPAGTQMPQ